MGNLVNKSLVLYKHTGKSKHEVNYDIDLSKIFR